MNKEDIQLAIDKEIDNLEKQYGSELKLKLITIISLERMLHPEQKEKQVKLIPLADWNEHHDYPSVGSLYQLYHRREETGFDYCTVKNGRRILIDEDKYFEWVQNVRGKRNVS